MESNTDLIRFEDTIYIGRSILASSGMSLNLSKEPTREKLTKTNLLFQFGLWNLRTAEFCYVIYLYLAVANRTNLLPATISLTCLAGCALSEYKVNSLQRKQKQFNRILIFLYKNFPDKKCTQDYYGLAEVHRATTKLTKIIFVGVTLFIWSYNLFPLLEGGFRTIVLGEQFSYPVPYELWLPFRTDRPVAYIILNIFLILSAITVSQFYIGADAMLYAIINQVCMHFDYISKRIRDYCPSGSGEDFDFIKEIVELHNEVLKISHCINEVFTNSILFNFFGSALIICGVGFLVTLLGISADLVKLSLYLVTSIFQIFILCSFGDKLIQSSSNISQAVYEHNWFNADRSYKKAMVLIMLRAQKPAVLAASYFSIASYESFRAIMTTSYQYFAILRQMYSK